MQTDFIATTASAFQEKGYLAQIEPNLAGVRGLLYVHSPKAIQLGFAKVFDHFLFVDWEEDVFSRLDQLIQVHKKFSETVNRGFKVPRAWRMTIPNLATVAVSETEFPLPAVEHVRRTYYIPALGGEAGQIMLLKLPEKILHSHPRPATMGRQTGSIPLMHAVDLITKAA
jgi:hypothetical protein